MKHPDLAPSLFLLAHDPVTGRHAAGRETVCAALVGAVLADLLIAGLVGQVGGAGQVGRVAVTGRRVPRPADPVVGFVVEAIAHQDGDLSVAGWVAAVGEPVYELVAAGLVDTGVLRCERSRRLRAGPVERYPVLDPVRAARPRLEIEHMIGDPRAFDLPGAVAVALCGALGVGDLPGPGHTDLGPGGYADVVAELPPGLRALITDLAGPVPVSPPRGRTSPPRGATFPSDGRFAGSRLRVESAAMTRRGRGGPDPASLRARHDEIVRRGIPDGPPDELERVVADCTHDLGPWHPDTMVAEGNLAVAYLAAGRADVGIPLLVATLAGRERVLGPDHPATLTAHDVLASVHRTAGRPAQALALYESVVARRTRVLGPRHPDTLTSRLGLGLSRADAGDLRAALALLDPARADAAVACGPGHRSTIALRGALAACLVAYGRPGQARAELTAAWAEAVRALGADDPDTVALRDALADLSIRAGALRSGALRSGASAGSPVRWRP